MSSRLILPLWLVGALFLSWEYYAINHAPQMSFLHHVQPYVPALHNTKLSTRSSQSVGYALGWTGIGIILLTNFYVLRKRFGFMGRFGKNSHWLNFHILCGLLGPTCIVFHSNFKVGGLVALSFWSMIIVAISGMMGRYFYLQIIREIADIQKETHHWERALSKMIKGSQKKVSDEKLKIWKKRMIRYVGADIGEGYGPVFLIRVFLRSLQGDLRLMLAYPRPITYVHPESHIALCNYALSVRREKYLVPFQTLLGYWHSFHVPFTILMYIGAAIHIGVTLTFTS